MRNIHGIKHIDLNENEFDLISQLTNDMTSEELEELKAIYVHENHAVLIFTTFMENYVLGDYGWEYTPLMGR